MRRAPNDSAPQGEIRIDDARIRSVDATHFNIEASARTFFLQASTEREKDNWISTLNKARVEFVKQLVTESRGALDSAGPGGGGAGAGGIGVPGVGATPDSAMGGAGGLKGLVMGALPSSAASGGKGEQQHNVWDIESHAIVKEGVLSKQGGQIKTWKQRWFVLRGHQLYYYQKAADKVCVSFFGNGNCTFF